MKEDFTFAGIEEDFATFENAKVLLQNIPYDGTSTWGKGADKGFAAFLEAAENMELYDVESGKEVFREGIHILDPILEDSSPESMYEATYENTKTLLRSGKFLTFFGGEHSVSIGIIKAHYEAIENISILQIDAHADLRPSYLGTKYNHACAVYDASQNSHLVQVGIRSMDIEERKYLDPETCFFMKDIYKDKTESWMQKSINIMKDNVYITLDLDAFDPSIMPATGTPEPGGFNWYQMLSYLKMVFEQKNVVGFDIVELAPIKGNKAPQFLTAKLYYKMLNYKFYPRK